MLRGGENYEAPFCFAPLLLLAAGAAHADKYSDAIASFKNAGDSAVFFQTCYGYAVFPTVGEAGFMRRRRARQKAACTFKTSTWVTRR